MIAAPEANDKQEHVRDELYRVRLRNALAFAWIRVAAVSLWLTVFLIGWRCGLDLALAPGPVAIVGATHLALGIGLLCWIRRRPSQSAVLSAALVDLVLVSLAAAFAVHSGPRAAQNLMLYSAVLQLLLLLDGLTVERGAVGAMAAYSWALVAGLAAYHRVWVLDAVVDLVVLGAFGVTIALMGSRFLALAARSALQEFTADVAERHARELEVVNAALRAAQAQGRELSSLIVHDLRNPLVSIWVTLDEVREMLPVRYQEAIDVAIGELRRVGEMIGQLLIVDRLESESILSTSLLAIDELLAEVERGSSPLLRKAGARFELRKTSDAPAVRADPRLLRRMLDNLVANAARHVRPGDRVEVAAEGDGECLRLAVRNSGPPVSAAVRGHLFEKHASTGGSDGRNFGLGLYLCRLVAERHGGSIALVDRQGWNVSFEVTLPAP